MEFPANLRSRVIANKPTLVKRGLTGKGKLQVVKGMEVGPSDILGTFEVSAGFSSIPLAQTLGVPRTEAVKYLQRPLGSKIYKGELLAFKKGLFGKKIVIAPTDGIVQSYHEGRGELQLRFLPKAVPLTSGVFGIVEEVNQLTGEVLIKTMVTEIKGVLGSGNERGGIIHVLSDPSSLLEKGQISPSQAGQILVSGALVLGESLRRAAGLGVSGIVSGGLNARDFKAMAGSLAPYRRLGSDAGISVLATEGFGSVPMGEDIFLLINEYQGKFALISGNNSRLILPTTDRNCIMTLRKVSLPALNEPENSPNIAIQEIGIGSKVRIIWPPFAGSQAVVVGIDKSATTLLSGISTYLLTVQTRSRKFKVPFTNIELLA